MNRYRNQSLIGRLGEFFKSFLPNKTDGIKQIIIKLTFLLCIIGVLCSGLFFADYYYSDFSDQRFILEQRRKFSEDNNSFKTWISFPDTSIDNPVLQTYDNSYFLNHNSENKQNNYGSLFFDYRSEAYHSNRVIYGSSPENGTLFAELHKLRQIKYYKQHCVFRLTESGISTEYKVYAVMVLNSKKEQDNGYLYNIYWNDFKKQSAFDSWVNEAKSRSVIETEVDVASTDKIITLVTSCDDFQGARLVVMARAKRVGEDFSYGELNAKTNPTVRYPKNWYTERNIKYPFE